MQAFERLLFVLLRLIEVFSLIVRLTLL